MIFTLLCLIIGSLYGMLIIYFGIGWMKTPQYHPKINEFTTKVSVLVPFRNEEGFIKQCLEELMDQDYPSELYEIIAIDDHSSDNSVSLVEELLGNNPKMKLLNMNDVIPSKSFKKLAITKAVNNSTGTLIITTDADCSRNKHWLSELVAFYEEHDYKMIVAPVVYNSNTLFGKMQALEFMSLVGVTGGSIFVKLPLMCNGANIAWERKTFEEVEGFNGNEHIVSGDDVFLMQKFKKHFNNSIGYIKSTNARVITSPSESLKSFFSQRVRWAGKNKLQPDKITIVVAMVVLAESLIIFLSLILAIFIPYYFYLFGMLFLFKCLVDVFLLYPTVKMFNQKFLLRYFLLVELVYLVYVPFTGIYSLFGKSNWKGRVN